MVLVGALAVLELTAPSPALTASQTRVRLRSVLHVAQLELNILMNQSGLSADMVVRGISRGGDLHQFLPLLSKISRLAAGTESDVVFSVFGGSASCGAELVSLDGHFAHILARWFDRSFGSRVTLLNMAVGSTSSDYYAMCAGQHLQANVDLVLGEHALNDANMRYGPNLYAPHQASITEQLLLQIRRHAPRAAFVYAGLLPVYRQCTSGEDWPGVLDAVDYHGASAVSVRDLVLNSPSHWAGPTTYCGNLPCNCNLQLQPPFDWDQMFPGHSHPTEAVHAYLAILLAKLIITKLGEFLELDSVPLHSTIRDHAKPPLFQMNRTSNSWGEVAFSCRTALFPNFGLLPLPMSSSCSVTWEMNAPVMSNCPDIKLEDWWSAQYHQPDHQSALSLLQLGPDELPWPPPGGWPDIAGWRFAEPFLWDHGHGIREDHKFGWQAQGGGGSIRFVVRSGPKGHIGAVYFTLPGAGTARFCVETSGTNNSVRLLDMLDDCVIVDGSFDFRITKTALLFRQLLPHTWYVIYITPEAHFTLVALASA